MVTSIAGPRNNRATVKLRQPKNSQSLLFKSCPTWRDQPKGKAQCTTVDIIKFFFSLTFYSTKLMLLNHNQACHKHMCLLIQSVWRSWTFCQKAKETVSFVCKLAPHVCAWTRGISCNTGTLILFQISHSLLAFCSTCGCNVWPRQTPPASTVLLVEWWVCRQIGTN